MIPRRDRILWVFVTAGNRRSAHAGHWRLTSGQMLWGIITKSKLNIFLFLWILTVSFACMAALSCIPVLALRYFYLPQDEVSIPLDFVPKTVRSPQNQYHLQLVAAHDLSKVKEMANVDYSVDLVLKLPRNAANLEYGNFGIRSALADFDWTASRNSLIDNAKAIDSASTGPNITEKMALIPYKSPFIEALSTYLWSPLYVLGFSREESQLIIKLWSNTDRPKLKHPFVLVMIPREIWVSEASLKLVVRLNGLRWLLKRFPTTTFLLSSAAFMLCEIIGTTTILMFAYAKIVVASSSETRVGPHVNSNSSAPGTQANPHESRGNATSSAPTEPAPPSADGNYRSGSKLDEDNKEAIASASQLKAEDELNEKQAKGGTERPKDQRDRSFDEDRTIVRDTDSSSLLKEAEVGLLSPEYT